MILRCEGLIENIVECKGRIFRMCYLDGMRLIENIVECKGPNSECGRYEIVMD